MNAETLQTDLLNLGFEYLTEWELREEKIKPRSLDWEEASRWIYAFVAEGRVRYIGITTTVLRTRLDGYSYQINDRVGALVEKLLKAEQPVYIYGLRLPNYTKEELERQESELIKKLATEWNVRR